MGIFYVGSTWKKQFYVTLLPKSITTAIGMGISEELGGIVTITVAAIVITGIIGNMFAEGICKLCKIEHPIAKGLAIGTASMLWNRQRQWKSERLKEQ